MGLRQQRGRPINGILLLDKPLGITSNAALQRVKQLYFAQKAGHTGSLDPLATGMLPICFGEATKLAQYLLNADKHYQVTAQLGIKTTTADSEGSVTSTRPVRLNQAQLEATLEKFRGNIQQIPSMFSALKFQGQPLYKLARQGIEIEREARSLTIHSLQLLNFSNDQIILDVRCSKGTYVRNLIESIGDDLDCGAHVIALRRLSTGHYASANMISLEQLLALKTKAQFTAMDELLMPLETMLANMPDIQLTAVSAFQLQQGNTVQIFNNFLKGLVRLYRMDGSFIGVGEMLEEGKLAPRRLVKPALVKTAPSSQMLPSELVL